MPLKFALKSGHFIVFKDARLLIRAASESWWILYTWFDVLLRTIVGIVFSLRTLILLFLHHRDVTVTFGFKSLQSFIDFTTLVEPISRHWFVVSFGKEWLEFLKVFRYIDCLEQLICDTREIRLPRTLSFQSHGEWLVHTIKACKLLWIDLEQLALDQLIAVWSLISIYLYHEPYYLPNVIRVMIWDPWVLTFANSFEKLIHIFAAKWRL